jgi:hypothetical protein
MLELRIAESAQETVRLVLVRGRCFKGRVVDVQGHPLSGVRLALSSRNACDPADTDTQLIVIGSEAWYSQTCQSDANGDFTVQGLGAGAVYVFARMAGYVLVCHTADGANHRFLTVENADHAEVVMLPLYYSAIRASRQNGIGVITDYDPTLWVELPPGFMAVRSEVCRMLELNANTASRDNWVDILCLCVPRIDTPIDGQSPCVFSFRDRVGDLVTKHSEPFKRVNAASGKGPPIVDLTAFKTKETDASYHDVLVYSNVAVEIAGARGKVSGKDAYTFRLPDGDYTVSAEASFLSGGAFRRSIAVRHGAVVDVRDWPAPVVITVAATGYVPNDWSIAIKSGAIMQTRNVERKAVESGVSEVLELLCSPETYAIALFDSGGRVAWSTTVEARAWGEKIKIVVQ